MTPPPSSPRQRAQVTLSGLFGTLPLPPSSLGRGLEGVKAPRLRKPLVKVC